MPASVNSKREETLALPVRDRLDYMPLFLIEAGYLCLANSLNCRDWFTTAVKGRWGLGMVHS